ncbi:MAG TPA: BtpA/SgcQ family protein [Sorangium sp.]|nr:BtpA/SgcQ family protein [Sorangium sp.]
MSAPPPAAALVGVIHLPPLPHSPRFGGDVSAIVAATARDASRLQQAGFEGMIIENFGDAPFAPAQVDAVVVAAMTRCVLAAKAAAPHLFLGVNVLRNDAHSALAIAAACGAQMVRINVHIGARVTDQGIVQGRAYDTVRRRAQLAPQCQLWCDVAVKHSAALARREVVEEAEETAARGLADALLVTGWGTGHAPASERVEAIAAAAAVPVYVASGATAATVAGWGAAHGVIVGSALRADGRAGGPIDAAEAQRFAAAWRKARA